MHVLRLRGEATKVAWSRARRIITEAPTLSYKQIADCDEGIALLRMYDARRLIFRMWFLFPLLLHERLERLVQQPRVHALLDGIAAAVLGLIAAVALQLCATLDTWPRAAIAAIALLVLLRWRWRLAVLPVMAGAAAFGTGLCS